MLYRLASIAIALFWVVMMVLLVRLETNPGNTGILQVPVDYVLKLMFTHGQQSLLTVREQGDAIGSISLRPAISGSNSRTLDFTGTIAIQLPLSQRQRYTFSGVIRMDAALRTTGFHANLSIPQTRCKLVLDGDSAANNFRYELRDGNRITAAQTLPLDAQHLTPQLLQTAGLPPGAFAAMPTTGLPQTTVTARETRITIHAEQVQVYEIQVSQSQSDLMDIYVTQLGQVVMAKTNFGYTFAMEDVQ